MSKRGRAKGEFCQPGLGDQRAQELLTSGLEGFHSILTAGLQGLLLLLQTPVIWWVVPPMRCRNSDRLRAGSEPRVSPRKKLTDWLGLGPRVQGEGAAHGSKPTGTESKDCNARAGGVFRGFWCLKPGPGRGRARCLPALLFGVR